MKGYTKYENHLPEKFSLFDEEQPSDKVILMKLKQAKRNGNVVIGECIKCEEDGTGGTLVIYFSENIKGFIPREEVSYKVESDGKVHIDLLRTRVGLDVECVVKNIEDNEDGTYKVELSRKDAVVVTREKYKKELKEGMVVKGVVVSLNDTEALVDIGGDVVGILGAGHISRVWIDKPSDVLKLGQLVDVVVTKWIPNDSGRDRIEFNREVLLPSFDEIDKYYKKGDTILGTIKGRLIDGSGIFVGLNESFEGLADPVTGRKYKKGEKARVRIEYISKDKKKIKLRFV